MIKAIIFDFFDVIRTDSYKSWLQQKGLRLEGEYKDVNVRMDRGLITVEQFLEELSRLCGDSPEKIWHDMEHATTLNHELLELISELKQSYKIALLSNAPSDFLRSLLQDHSLEPYFDEIIVSSEVSMIKPHPEIFELTLSKLAVEASQAIFIDDNPHNVAGGEAVGITGIIYTDLPALKTALAKLLN